MHLSTRLHRWFIRPDHDRQQPIVLTQRRIFILPTSTGMAYTAVLITMLVGTINYNLSLGYALVFLLVGLGLVSMVHTFHNLAGLMITPGRMKPVFAGETAHCPVFLDNTRHKERRAIELNFAGNEAVSVSIPATGKTQASIAFKTRQRGQFTPGHITLATCYPLGFFRAWSYPYPQLSCLVYPQPEQYPLPPRTPMTTPGCHRNSGGQEDFSGLRLRDPADSPRRIAWKAVARNAEGSPLLVKNFSGGANEELWLDWQLTPMQSDTEHRLSILAGWVLAAEAEQLAYGLDIPGCRILPGSGPSHRDTCLKALALHGHDPEAH